MPPRIQLLIGVSVMFVGMALQFGGVGAVGVSEDPSAASLGSLVTKVLLSGVAIAGAAFAALAVIGQRLRHA